MSGEPLLFPEARSPVAFIKCLPFVLKEEVEWQDPFVWSDVKHNFSNDKGDPGGATMCGITHREYDLFRKTHAVPTRPVQLITEAEGHWIYYHWYWRPHCETLPPGLNLSFFDSAVNEGSTEAIHILQVALGLANDGVWGPKTAAAVSAITPGTVVADIIKDHARRVQVYRQTKGFGRFGKDWIGRADRIEKASLAMAA